MRMQQILTPSPRKTTALKHPRPGVAIHPGPPQHRDCLTRRRVGDGPILAKHAIAGPSVYVYGLEVARTLGDAACRFVASYLTLEYVAGLAVSKVRCVASMNRKPSSIEFNTLSELASFTEPPTNSIPSQGQDLRVIWFTDLVQ